MHHRIHASWSFSYFHPYLIISKKMRPVRSEGFERHSRIAAGNTQTVEYIATVTV